MAARVSSMSWPLSLLSFPLVFIALVAAQERHDEEVPPPQSIAFDPIGSILWAHIFFMSLSFGILFPVGMVRHHPIRRTVCR